MKNNYFDFINTIEGLHRKNDEIINYELQCMGVLDINETQIRMLYGIGHKELTIKDIRDQGCYLGTNITYNLKKMVANQYVIQEQSRKDRRSTRIKLSKKGIDLFNKFEEVFEKYCNRIIDEDIAIENMIEDISYINNMWNEVLKKRKIYSADVNIIDNVVDTDDSKVQSFREGMRSWWI